MATTVMPGAEGFELGGGPIGALLVHGYSSSPQTLRGLGDHLAGRGLTVSAPLLPGHGTSVADLARRHPEEWVDAARRAYDALAARCQQVFVVGNSFGSALAADLVASHPEVRGMVAMASVVRMDWWKRSMLGVIRWVVPTVAGVGNDISDPALRHELGYDRLPSKTTYAMMRYLTTLPPRLEAIRCPVLILHGRHDHEAPAKNPALIRDRVSSSQKELVWMERSWHVITLDVEREDVFRRVYQFITALS